MHFDKYEKLGAYHWDWYDDPNYAWYKECVDRCVSFCKGSTLDVGGGDGLLSSKLIDKGLYSVVIDNNPSGLRLYYEKRGLDNAFFETVDIDSQLELDRFFVNKGDYPRFDYMACLNVIEHMKNPKMIVYIFENCIDKGGIIITDQWTGNPGRYHEHEYNIAELVHTFKKFKPKPFEINSTEFGKPATFIGVEIKK
jgi:2-polyprenyl-3-methyl-5-hydroxy-6-metoxy-1,4-benzoquinol methylase